MREQKPLTSNWICLLHNNISIYMILTKNPKRCGELKYQPPSILTECDRLCNKWSSVQCFSKIDRISYLRSFYYQILISGFSNNDYPESVNENLEKSFFYERPSIKICFFDLRIPYNVSIHVLTDKKWVFSCKFAAYFQNTFS